MEEHLSQRDDDDWLPSAIYLVDNSPKVVAEWTEAFVAIPEVVPIAGNYSQRPADAIH